MKKYIRTKDGKIYDSLALRIDEFVYLDEKGLPHREYKVKDITKSILKIADTIEELCDEFVMNTSLTHYENSHLKDLLLEYNKFYYKEDIKIYGAIWTDKGLIYVAKMNDKGELELL